jgi:uncharacterized protein (DUF302 family)
MNEIAFQINLKNSFHEAVELVTAALKDEGFGVLTNIDVKATLKEKIGADFREYAILGACNPPLAHKALQAEPLIGLLLPCNVTVEATENGSAINLMNPKAILLTNPDLASNQTVREVAEDAYNRLTRVVNILNHD